MPTEDMSLKASDLSDLYDAAYRADGSEREALLTAYRRKVDTLPVIKIGPTWRSKPEGKDHLPGKYDLPEWTLGWEVIAWIKKYIIVPGKGLTNEQMRFILWWYAIERSGRFAYRTGVLQRCKGWGKDPLLAILCLVEFVGPCRFSHWGEDGKPVAKSCDNAWVQIAAVSATQTRTTSRMFPSLMSQKLIDEYDIKAGVELIRAEGGTRIIECLTSNPDTIEGGRSTFIVLNETHHWKRGNRGDEMYDVIDGNASKMTGRYLAITNAYLPDQDSVAQKMRENWAKIEEGLAFDVGMLYDSIEADPRSPMTAEAMEIVLPKVRGDAYWLDILSTIQSALFGARKISQSRRMYYNQIVASEDAIYTEAEWDILADLDLALSANDRIVLGFDGGKTNDATALVAIRIKDRAIFLLGCWQKPPEYDGPWQVNRAEVNSRVNEAFRKYKVVGFYADVAEWTSYIDTWHESWGEGLLVKSQVRGNSIAWDMRQGGAKPTLAHERLVEAIQQQELQHNGDKTLRRHILNVRERWNNYGLSFGKDGAASDKKIDAYAALLLAYECLHDFRTRPVETEAVGAEVTWV